MNDSVRTEQILGQFEAEVTHTLLARCSKCEAPHPAAMGYDPAKCHECGEPTTEPTSYTVKSTQTIRDPLLLIGQGCLIVAQRLRSWIERQEK